MSSIAKSVLPIAASFIPGVGAIAGPALGALMGGIGSGGNQGGTTYNTFGTQSQNQTTNQSVKNLEPDYFSQFREGLLGQYNSELSKAQNETIYGPAQKAQYISGQNDLASAATEAAKAGLARMGRLNSGAADEAAGNIEYQKFGNISNFYSQLPFMESEARFNKVSPLLTAGMNWAGRAPVDQEITGNTSSTGTNQSQTIQQQQGAPWWKNMLYGIGGAMGRTGTTGSSSSSNSGYGIPYNVDGGY